MWKTITAFAFLILSIGITSTLILGAHAEPQSSLGSNPVASFGGVFSSSNQTIFTAPSDQDFVVKTILTQEKCEIYVGGSLMVSQHAYFSPTMYWFNAGSHDNPSSSSAFQMGRANLKVPAGSSLSVQNCNSSRYYIDGHYVHP